MYHLDPSSGELTHAATVAGPGTVNPSFLTVGPNRSCLYAVNEITGGRGPQGTVSAFAIDPVTGDLTYLNQQSTHGLAPCYASVEPEGRYCLVANYETGSLCVLPIQKDGRLGEATDMAGARLRRHRPSRPFPTTSQARTWARRSWLRPPVALSTPQTGGTTAWQSMPSTRRPAGCRWSGMNRREKIYLYPNSHAGYYPGAKYIAMKVLFRKSDGRLLGAQMLGEDGVPKRIDALAMAIQAGFTIYDLEEVELSYAPPFGSAKDPVNFAGMVVGNILRDDMPIIHWAAMDGGFLLDVRQTAELAVEYVPGAANIPLPELRARLGELPRDREILVFCRSGQRAYYAMRVLLQNGFKARNIAGGMLSCSHLAEAL